MTKTEHYFWKVAAEARAKQLTIQGFSPYVWPGKTWGPEGCFHIPLSGWMVVWLDNSATP